jgi:hypothetical protein
MNGWIDQLHSNSTAFPPAVTSIHLAVALAIGLLVGFERQLCCVSHHFSTWCASKRCLPPKVAGGIRIYGL